MNIKRLIAKFRIPKGDYCYTIKKIVPDETYGYRIVINPCPYYDGSGYRANCKLLNEGDILLDDQCKICGINVDDSGDGQEMVLKKN